jgi:hypothetical protein
MEATCGLSIWGMCDLSSPFPLHLYYLYFIFPFFTIFYLFFNTYVLFQCVCFPLSPRYKYICPPCKLCSFLFLLIFPGFCSAQTKFRLFCINLEEGRANLVLSSPSPLIKVTCLRVKFKVLKFLSPPPLPLWSPPWCSLTRVCGFIEFVPPPLNPHS